MSDTKVIETALVKANITEATIKSLEESYMPLVVKSTEDFSGYQAVVDARKDVKTYRIDIEKFLKALREPAFAFQKAVVAKEKEIVARLAKIEDHLEEQEDFYKMEVETPITPEEADKKKLTLLKRSLTIEMPVCETVVAQEIVKQVKALVDQALNIF